MFVALDLSLATCLLLDKNKLMKGGSRAANSVTFFWFFGREGTFFNFYLVYIFHCYLFRLFSTTVEFTDNILPQMTKSVNFPPNAKISREGASQLPHFFHPGMHLRIHTGLCNGGWGEGVRVSSVLTSAKIVAFKQSVTMFIFFVDL